MTDITLTPVDNGTVAGDNTGESAFDAFARVNTNDEALRTQWKDGTESGFQSLGIDDNATSEKMQIGNSALTLGSAGSSYEIEKADGADYLGLSGGSNIVSGANILLYGENKAVIGNDIAFRVDATNQLYYDDSGSLWDFQANNIVTTGAFDCGAFTSTGIDDNATAERLQIADTLITMGGGTTSSVTTLRAYGSQGYFEIQASGLLTTNEGAHMRLYADSHATQPNDIEFLSDGDVLELRFDDSNDKWDFQANAISTTGILSCGSFLSAGDLTIDAASGEGIKIGNSGASDFGWNDMLGEINIRGTGPTDPSWTQVDTTGFWDYAFSVNDECWINFHVPHDYVPGTDIYIHAHWITDGTDTNTVKWQFETAYADGFGGGVFPLASATTTTAEEAATGTQYTHMITETAAITIAGMEVDGIIKCKVTRITNGGTDNIDGIFLQNADIHYQSTGLPTKNKAPDFYT